MTKKDYKAFANIFSQFQGNPNIVLGDIVFAAAVYFASENPRFDAKKFLLACGCDEFCAGYEAEQIEHGNFYE